MIHSKKHTRALAKIFGRRLHPLRFGVEVGVWAGNNSANLLRQFPSLHLIMVDRWSATAYSQLEMDKRMRTKAKPDYDLALKMARNRTAFAGSRRTIMIGHSVNASAIVRPHSQDFVFIDADHSYASVLTDIAAWRNKVRPGGILSGHDYNSKGDRLGLFGVKRAVDETFGEGNINVVGYCCVWWVRL